MSTELNSLLEAGTGMDTQPEQHKVSSNGSQASANGLSVSRSEKIGQLIAALCKAQLEFAPVVKSNINPQFRSKYADLATIINATMPALAKNGLAVIQTPRVNGRELTMTTLLVHSSDEWLANELTMPATMRNELTAQTIGSACTYSRRYALQSMLGIAADVDDDATEASGGGTQAAANAVADKKIKAAVESGKTAALFYVWNDGEQKGYVTGDLKLIEANVELLRAKGTWSVKEKAFITNANGLEDYKYELGQRGIPFMPLKGTEVTAALQESIAQAKAKKARE